MSMFTIPLEKLVLHKLHYQRYIQEDPELTFIDKPMRPIVKLFNKVPGISTLFCCSGHPKKREFKGHVIMVVTEQGKTNLEIIFDNLLNNETLIKYDIIHYFDLKYLKLYDRFTMDMEYRAMLEFCIFNHHSVNSTIYNIIESIIKNFLDNSITSDESLTVNSD